jgi:hypothetical protein
MSTPIKQKIRFNGTLATCRDRERLLKKSILPSPQKCHGAMGLLTIPQKVDKRISMSRERERRPFSISGVL